MRCKIAKWLRNHASLGSSQKNLKVKIKSLISSKDETGATDSSDDIMVSESDITDPVAVKSVPPQRRTKSSVMILKDNKIICSSDEIINDNGVMMDEVSVDRLAKEETNDSNKASILDATGEVKHQSLIFASKVFWHVNLFCLNLYLHVLFTFLS